MSVDGGCAGVRNVRAGVIDATSQQYPLLMASRGVTAVVTYAKTNRKVSGYTDTGVNLIARQGRRRRSLEERRLRARELLGLAPSPDRGVPSRDAPVRPRIGEDRAIAPMTTDVAADAEDGCATRRAACSPRRRWARSSRCCAAIAFFSFKSDRFLQAQNLSLVLQQVMVVGVLAIGQTLVILTAGIDLSCGTVMALGQIVMTKLAVANGVAADPGAAPRHRRVRRLRDPERSPRHGRPAARLHRHARHAQHRLRADPHLLGRPDVLGLTERAALLRPHLQPGGRGFHLRRRPDARALRVLLVPALPDGLGPARLRRRRQPRGRAADGDQDRPGPAQRLHDRGSHVRDRGDAARRAHGARRSERRPDHREPRRHHRRRARRARASSAAAAR